MVFIKDICIIRNGNNKRINNNNKRINNNMIGEYPVYGAGHKILFYTNDFNREGKTCKISKFKSNLDNEVIILNEKYFLKETAFTIESNDQNLLSNEYLWNYLKNNRHLIQYTGSTLLRIDMQHFMNIDIII